MGKPTAAPAQPAAFLNPEATARFWTLVDRRGPDECWPWRGKLGGRDYGRIMVTGKHYGAHIFAWMIENQSYFPVGMKGLHRCDNPICVNPSHIWPGTQLENMRDCIAKGRSNFVPPVKPFATHCIHGHPFDEANTWISPRTGWRTCRTCGSERTRRARQLKGRSA